MANAGKFSCRRLSASLPALASFVNAPTCTKSAPPESGDFRSVAAAEASEAGVIAAFALDVFGVAVLDDCGAACGDAPSTFDFWANASPTGRAAEEPEEELDASASICWVDCFTVPAWSSACAAADGLVAFVLAASGAAVFGDCGAACVDAPSNFDFAVDASLMGAAPAEPEEGFDACAAICWVDCFTVPASSSACGIGSG